MPLASGGIQWPAVSISRANSALSAWSPSSSGGFTMEKEAYSNTHSPSSGNTNRLAVRRVVIRPIIEKRRPSVRPAMLRLQRLRYPAQRIHIHSGDLALAQPHGMTEGLASLPVAGFE